MHYTMTLMNFTQLFFESIICVTKEQLWQIKMRDSRKMFPALITWILRALIAICAGALHQTSSADTMRLGSALSIDSLWHRKSSSRQKRRGWLARVNPSGMTESRAVVRRYFLAASDCTYR